MKTHDYVTAYEDCRGDLFRSRLDAIQSSTEIAAGKLIRKLQGFLDCEGHDGLHEAITEFVGAFEEYKYELTIQQHKEKANEVDLNTDA